MKVNRTLYAVLGMLLEGERSGYDLKKDFERRVAHFWNESMGQIHPALKRARELGWVRGRSDARGGRKRTAYTLTAKGRSALEAWFREEPAPPPVRNELLLKVFFGARLDREALLAHVEQFEAKLRKARRQYADFDAQIESQAQSPEQEALWKLTLSSGKHVNRARLAWCREARQVLEQLNEAESTS